MSRFRVAQQSRADCDRGATALWLTTADAARMLQLSVEGVKWLTRTHALRCERTPSGQRLFLRRDVRELAVRRADERVLTRDEVWRSLRVLRRTSAPRQLLLPLFGAARRKVTAGSGSETSAIVERTGVGLISGPMSTAKVDGRKRMARVDEVSRSRTAGGHRA